MFSGGEAGNVYESADSARRDIENNLLQVCAAPPAIPGCAAGVAEIVSGALAILVGLGVINADPLLNENSDTDKKEGEKPRGPKVEKADSPVWKGLKPHKGKTKTNGEKGKKKRYYEWDHTHGDIEVYDSNEKHLGSADPVTGEIYKPPIPGRTLNK